MQGDIQERDAAGKKCAASCRNISLSTANNGPKNLVTQKISVSTVNLKVMTSHGVHALVIILDTQTIVNPQTCQPIILETNPLVIAMNIATHAIVIILGATLVIDMITENAITSHQLVTTWAKVTMPNTATNPDQEHNHNHGPVLMILEPQDTIMVNIFMMMIPGEGIGKTQPLLSLVQDWNVERPLLKANLLLFNITI